ISSQVMPRRSSISSVLLASRPFVRANVRYLISHTPLIRHVEICETFLAGPQILHFDLSIISQEQKDSRAFSSGVLFISAPLLFRCPFEEFNVASFVTERTCHGNRLLFRRFCIY